jgi:hypothetical protein
MSKTRKIRNVPLSGEYSDPLTGSPLPPVTLTASNLPVGPEKKQLV